MLALSSRIFPNILCRRIIDLNLEIVTQRTWPKVDLLFAEDIELLSVVCTVHPQALPATGVFASL